MVKRIAFEELHLPITWNRIDLGFKSDITLFAIVAYCLYTF